MIKNVIALRPIDFSDAAVGEVIDCGAVSLPTDSYVEIVASLAASVHAIKVTDTTGRFIGLYTGASGSEELAIIIGMGENQYHGLKLLMNKRVSLKSLDGVAASEGKICIQFFGV